MFDLSGKNALVTGASGGIGREIAKTLHAAGANVGLAGTREAVLQELADALGEGAHVLVADLSSAEGAAALAANAEEAMGGLDILVNNAGITRDAPFHKMTRAQWSEVIDTNLSGVFNMTHPLWPGMRERKFGRVITISSINGQKGQFAQANYAASKAGDLGMTKTLAQEGARYGITANAICPGYIETDMVKDLSEKVIDGIVAQIPAGRLGQAEEIARCAVFLAADGSGFINGATLNANGAQYLA